MTFNTNYAEIYGRELRRDRMREAERERLIRQATLANPSLTRKIWLVLKDRWQRIWKPEFEIRPHHPAPPVPKGSPSR
jgi:hypothetical protein